MKILGYCYPNPLMSEQQQHKKRMLMTQALKPEPYPQAERKCQLE